MEDIIVALQFVGKGEDILVALQIMGKGMLGIFIALSIVYLFVILLNKLFPEKKKEVLEDEGADDK